MNMRELIKIKHNNIRNFTLNRTEILKGLGEGCCAKNIHCTKIDKDTE